MVNVPPAPRKTKGTPPRQSSTNLTKPSDGDTAPLNFTVPPSFRKDYKAFAVEHDMTMVQVLYESFEIYRKTKK